MCQLAWPLLAQVMACWHWPCWLNQQKPLPEPILTGQLDL